MEANLEQPILDLLEEVVHPIVVAGSQEGQKFVDMAVAGVGIVVVVACIAADVVQIAAFAAAAAAESIAGSAYQDIAVAVEIAEVVEESAEVVDYLPSWTRSEKRCYFQGKRLRPDHRHPFE